MFTGACAGSTAGGLKTSRICIAFKVFMREANSFLHPREIKQIKMDKKVVDNKTLRSVTIYFITYTFLFVISVLLIAIDGHDVVTTFTSVAATINNIGPGLEMVGPTQNYAFLSIPCKWVLIFDMLAGRLELFPMLMIFHPSIWKGSFLKHRRTY
jgi:trk system potassium uptake protein TrkH